LGDFDCAVSGDTALNKNVLQVDFNRIIFIQTCAFGIKIEYLLMIFELEKLSTFYTQLWITHDVFNYCCG
jgi:hypothetical protein